MKQYENYSLLIFLFLESYIESTDLLFCLNITTVLQDHPLHLLKTIYTQIKVNHFVFEKKQLKMRRFYV